MTSSQNENLQEFLQYAYDNASAVKDIFDGASLLPEQVKSVSDLENVPVTSKDRLAELQQENPPFGGFLAIPQDQLEHIFLSPGPLYEPHAGGTEVMGSIREMLELAGFKKGDVVLNAFGYHLIPTGLAVDETLRELGATVIAAGVGNADLILKMMRDLGVTGYVGTPSWMMALITKAEETGFDFNADFGLKNALVSAEYMPPSMRAAFVDKYGIAVTNAYGTAELGFLSYNQDGQPAMPLLETSIVQIANPETGKTVGAGEVGEVVVTNFSKTYPLIRLGTGDLAMNIDAAPGKSKQGERSIILVGRVGDAVKVRGMFLHPNQLNFAVAQIASVSRFQALITRLENRDDFILRVVLADDTADKEEVSMVLSQAIQSACRIKVDKYEFVSSDALKEGQPPIVDERTWE